MVGRILVSFGGNEAWDITGDEVSMREQYEAFKERLVMVDGTASPFFRLHGFRNLADRKSEEFVVRVEDVKGVDFQEL